MLRRPFVERPRAALPEARAVRAGPVAGLRAGAQHQQRPQDPPECHCGTITLEHRNLIRYIPSRPNLYTLNVQAREASDKDHHKAFWDQLVWHDDASALHNPTM